MFQTKVALLDQVQKLHAGGQRVAAGHAYHQAQVGPDEAVLGPVGGPDGTLDLATSLPGFLAGSSVSPSLDDLGQFPFLLGVQEGNHADLVQILAYGITHVLLLFFFSWWGTRRAPLPLRDFRETDPPTGPLVVAAPATLSDRYSSIKGTRCEGSSRVTWGSPSRLNARLGRSTNVYDDSMTNRVDRENGGGSVASARARLRALRPAASDRHPRRHL